MLLALNCFFATLVIFCKNSLFALINLIFLIIGSCTILFYFKIEFLAFILLLIYVGAITILFLFIVMMLQLNEKETTVKESFYLSLNNCFLYVILLIKLSFILFYFNKKLALSMNKFSFEFIKYNTDINLFYKSIFFNSKDINFFLSLFTQKYFFFIIIGIILLFAMIGSISLCLKSKN
jgi:NADH:ubiquinone oxidoreductase subunit 6 (subunit J)